MKLKLLLLILLCLCVTLFATTINAGVEPSPFHPFLPEINQLGAVENGLNSCYDRVLKLLPLPQDDFRPNDDFTGVVNRLEAIDGQVISLNDFVANTIYSVMGVEPSPFGPDDPLILALEAVRDVSEAIVIYIDEHPPDPCVPPDPCSEFNSALENIKTSAMYLTGTVEWGIEQLSGGSGVCVPAPDLTTEAQCLARECSWISTGGEPYCCCIIGS